MQEGDRAPRRQWRTENRIVLVLGPWPLGASEVEAVGTQLLQIPKPVFSPGKETGWTGPWVFQAFAGASQLPLPHPFPFDFICEKSILMFYDSG